MVLLSCQCYAGNKLGKPINNMHVDQYMSQVVPWSSILGKSGQSSYQITVSNFGRSFVTLCPTILENKLGNIVTICVQSKIPELLIKKDANWFLAEVDPVNLKTLAKIDLPKRHGSLSEQKKDTSGGAYFIKDDDDNVVVTTSDRVVRKYQLAVSPTGKHSWSMTSNFDLKPYLGPECNLQGNGYSDNCGKIIGEIYDHSGNLWFETDNGYIGYITDENEISVKKLNDTITKGGITVSDGNRVNIIADHKLYSFKADEHASNENKIQLVWSHAYDTADSEQKGGLGLGSNTSPTLFGDKHQYVAIADRGNKNNNYQEHLLVYKEDTGELVCKTPVFQAGKSLINNSFIGYQNSIIALNSYGDNSAASGIIGQSATPGLIRIDIKEHKRKYKCKVKWLNNNIYATATPEMSAKNKLIYVYNYKKEDKSWYLSTVNFHNGKIIKSLKIGQDSVFPNKTWNNRWGIVTLLNDHAVYVGMSKGFLQIQ